MLQKTPIPLSRPRANSMPSLFNKDENTPLLGASSRLLPHANTTSTASFSYEHDPSYNLVVQKDAIKDPNAIYGYKPNPEGSLKEYASYNWSDVGVVYEARKKRLAYRNNITELVGEYINDLSNLGTPDELIAKLAINRRNMIRIESYTGSKAQNNVGLATAQSRSQNYTYDFMKKKYETHADIFKAVVRENAAMDACTGLYDMFFESYPEKNFVGNVKR